ncbi:DUF3427 domain-containing protein [Candidatus Venteria ishoeyi]|uniref:DUF3427 domain-containing protein n=1 Tax=Candidatus Venteria ishoeyi TaxID=1899563 RepID=A0A1H6F4M9_9GAMM|nr:DUF3427 domain-containing protein [Candidatus Venteria ishoeyi]SEH04219.1 Uncharacterised protein [Candidatus Venteria ishoeyi]
MAVTFKNIVVGREYSRPDLADIWGYKGYQAIARGVVTPRDSNIIILFVTEVKQDFQEQYQDQLDGKILKWEGPTDHFAEKRMINANKSTDQIHVFHRIRHHTDFRYLGLVHVESYKLFSNKPSRFILNAK